MFFFTKHGPPVPRGRRLLRVALMMQLSMRPVPAFFDFCILQTYWFFNPVSVFFAQKGPPNEFFCNFFGCVFGPARVQISSTLVLRSVFFCSVKKMCSKALIGYAAWGLPQGSTFACAVTTINKTKKLKLKKLEPNCSIVVTAFSLRFHSVRQIVLLW